MVRTKRERSCAQCGTGFTGRGNRATYCSADCRRLSRNHAQNEWNRIKRELGPVIHDLADDDPESFWESVRDHGDTLSIWPEVRRLSGRPNGATGYNGDDDGNVPGETGNSGSRYMPADPDRPQPQWTELNWTADNFIDNDRSRVCVNGAWVNKWIKLENVTHKVCCGGLPVWSKPAYYGYPLPAFSTIDKRGEGCIHYTNGCDPIPDCQACSDRWASHEHDERTVRVTDLCQHDLVPVWCAFCTGKSREPFINQSSENWSQVNRLRQLLNTPREAMNNAEHYQLPGNSPDRGNSQTGGEGQRTDLEILQDTAVS